MRRAIRSSGMVGVVPVMMIMTRAVGNAHGAGDRRPRHDADPRPSTAPTGPPINAPVAAPVAAAPTRISGVEQAERPIAAKPTTNSPSLNLNLASCPRFPPPIPVTNGSAVS